MNNKLFRNLLSLDIGFHWDQTLSLIKCSDFIYSNVTRLDHCMNDHIAIHSNVTRLDHCMNDHIVFHSNVTIFYHCLNARIVIYIY